MQRHKRGGGYIKEGNSNSGRKGNVRSRLEDTMQNKQEEGKTVNW